MAEVYYSMVKWGTLSVLRSSRAIKPIYWILEEYLARTRSKVPSVKSHQSIARTHGSMGAQLHCIVKNCLIAEQLRSSHGTNDRNHVF